MTKRMMSWLERARTARSADTSALQLLRLKWLSQVVRQRLEHCLATSDSQSPAFALARVSPGAVGRRINQV